MVATRTRVWSADSGLHPEKTAFVENVVPSTTPNPASNSNASMSRPRNPDIERWEWPELPGYVVGLQRESAKRRYCYHYYRGRRKSYRVPFSAEMKSVVREIHAAWVKRMVLQVAGVREQAANPPVIALQSDRPRSLFAAQRRYLEAVDAELSPNARQKLSQAMNAHFPHDLPLDHDTIASWLSDSLRESIYAPSTQRKHTIALRRLFRYCVVQRWVDRDPVDDVGRNAAKQ